ncbi:MAG: hypothetical protein U1A78_11480 [Polyangia bacterium]
MNKLACALPGLLLWGQSVSAQPAPPAQTPAVTRPETAAAEAKDRAAAAKRPQVRTYSTVTVLDDPAKAPPLPTVRRELPAREPAGPAEPRIRPPAGDRPEAAPGPARDDKPTASEVTRERAALRELREQLRSERRELHARPEPARADDRPTAPPPSRPPAGRREPDENRAAAREQKLERAQRREQKLEQRRKE